LANLASSLLDVALGLQLSQHSKYCRWGQLAAPHQIVNGHPRRAEHFQELEPGHGWVVHHVVR
jgi:hypothetical protein